MIPAPEKPEKLSLGAANALPAAAFRDHLQGLFEHSPWVVEGVVSQRPFASRGVLLAAMGRVVATADAAAQLALLRAHPVLGGGAARRGGLTAESASEQAGRGLDRMDGEEERDFAALNAAYLDRFGFPFIIAVRGQRDRAAIRAALRQRLAHDPAAEREAALAEVVKIAGFRLEGLIEEAPLSLSLHALDTARGGPAVGLGFTLHRVEAGAAGPALARAETDQAGRWRLEASPPLEAGLYELRFAAEAYQNRFDTEGFYEEIAIRFRLRAEGGHYHIPLILSPFGYSTYRGG